MVASKSEVIAPEETPDAPYVGLRPFEQHEAHLLFGRDQDALFLSDKLFAARLTVLYGVSGQGKSSLLRAKVIPKVGADQAQTLLFDAWAGEAPLEDLKEALAAYAEAIGVPAALAGAPSLRDLVGLILAADDRTFVLILDQFEEFLVNQNTRLDPLKKELAALVRDSSLDVRVVISLREEFLAALEPFKTDILSLFESTYRLVPLSPEPEAEAITGPAHVFGKDYERQLVARLLTDLRGESSVAPALRMQGEDGEMRTVGLDLSMLQLVCGRLWQEAEARQIKTLSLSLYEQTLGGRDRILANYVDAVMPKRHADKVLVARLMTSLAPPSGLKLSFSVDDLAQITEESPERIAAVLDPLAAARVLRTRKYGRATRYEIQHDALIEIIAPWRDNQLRRARLFRRVGVGSSFLVIVLAIGLGAIFYLDSRAARIYYENTEGRLAALDELGGLSDWQRKKRAEEAFDSVAGYLLWRETGPERFHEIRRLFTKYLHHMPQTYGIDISGLDTLLPLIPPSWDWPLMLTYSSDRVLDEYYFNLTWEDMAKFDSDLWGIPVPRRVKLIPSPELPRDMVELQGPGTEPLRFQIDTLENLPFVSSENIAGPEAEFLDYISNERVLFEGSRQSAPYWHVPRWSLPVWKLTGRPATSGSGALAVRIALELQDNAAPLFPDYLDDLLLARQPSEFAQTVAEAKAARGERLVDDLLELVNLKRGLTSLRPILDFAADDPNAASDVLASYIDERLIRPEITPSERFYGPWSEPAATSTTTPKAGEPEDGVDVPTVEPESTAEVARTVPGEHQQAYYEAIGWLRAPESKPLRIYIGKNLAAILDDPERWPNVVESLQMLRDWFWERHGWTFPGITFSAVSDESVPPNGFRVEILETEVFEQEIDSVDGIGVDTLMEELRYPMDTNRQWFITPEATQSFLNRLENDLRVWLDERYSLTDLKRLARYLIAPQFARLEPPPERTLRDLTALLSSLVFWEHYGDLHEVDFVLHHLWETQGRFRTAGEIRARPEDQAAALVFDGARLLVAGELAEANAAFRDAVKRSSTVARAAFLDSYPAFVRDARRQMVLEYCAPDRLWSLAREGRFELFEMIAEAEEAGETDRARMLSLCVVAQNNPSERPKARLEAIDHLRANYADVESWPVEEARWLAYEIIEHHDVLTHDPGGIAFADMLLDRMLAEPAEAEAFYDLLDNCPDGGPSKWCYDLVEGAAARNRETNPGVAADSVYSFSFSERTDRLDRAYDLAVSVDRELGTADMEDDERRLISMVVAFAKAQIDLQRELVAGAPSIGGSPKLKSAEATFRSLLDSEFEGIAYQSHHRLALALKRQDRTSDALEVLDASYDRWPADDTLRDKVNLLLDLGQIDEALKLTASFSEDDVAKLFTLARLRTLSRGPGWERTARTFLETDHEYVPYVAMMMFGTKAMEAEDEAVMKIRESWAEADPSSWDARLAAGDPDVWREMLIGYYLGEGGVDRRRLFDPLESEERFGQSEFSALPLSRRGMLTEALFYEALLLRSRGDLTAMEANLRQIRDFRFVGYLEYSMANYLLHQLEAQVAE